MRKLTQWVKTHWEVLAYLIFGGLTTLLNIVLYAVCNAIFGYKAANSWGNVLNNVLCILFAYITNRTFVFTSKAKGKAAWREFVAFVACRLGTLVLDAVIMLVGGNMLAAPGAALMQGLLGRDAAAAQDLWGLDVKIFSNVLVVVLNYVFSKLIVFKKG